MSNTIDNARITDSCREEIERELLEEWLHWRAPERCDFREYAPPIFRDEDFLTRPFGNEQSHQVQAHLPRIAYLIIAFRQHRMLKRLVERLQTSDRRHLILIHIDVHTSPAFEFRVRRLASRYTNVRVVRWGVIVYGSSSIVEVAFAAMNWFCNNSRRWDFFISLTGQDYPLLSAEVLGNTLRRFGNRTWMVGEDMSKECSESHLNLSVSLKKQWGRVSRMHYACRADGEKTLYRFGPREPWIFNDDRALPFCKGTSMSTGVFHRDTVETLLQDTRALRAYAFFRLTLIPEEHFWVSVLTALGTYENRTTTNERIRLLDNSPCEMSWTKGYGADGMHNTFLTTNEIPMLTEAIRKGRYVMSISRVHFCAHSVTHPRRLPLLHLQSFCEEVRPGCRLGHSRLH